MSSTINILAHTIWAWLPEATVGLRFATALTGFCRTTPRTIRRSGAAAIPSRPAGRPARARPSGRAQQAGPAQAGKQGGLLRQLRPCRRRRRLDPIQANSATRAVTRCHAYDEEWSVRVEYRSWTQCTTCYTNSR